MCNKEPFWAKKNEERWLQLKFNIDFLKKTKLEYGQLHCEYCGKTDLIIYDWCEKLNINDVATVDHFYPKSKYNDLKMDENNFIISCYSCNSQKKDKIWPKESVKYPLNVDKINNLIDGVNINTPC
jgi:5-methylcytosine-specific restriction endonuclease McrA